MKDVFKKQWIGTIIALLFCFIFLAGYSKVSFSQKRSSSAVTIEEASPISFNTDTTQVKMNYPLRLKIPVIGIDAEIEYIGLTPTGAMDTPQKADNVAWFSLGPLPGEEGTAVIAGHFDDKYGQGAVFYNLKEIQKDDKLLVEDDQGNIITFIVREIRVYDSEDLIPEVFISSEGQHLNLITCFGDWSRSRATYMQRLVVFADLYVL